MCACVCTCVEELSQFADVYIIFFECVAVMTYLYIARLSTIFL